ncbi:hypothetical protein [Novosphingobium sp.]|uniref:hypothetical protein n=1 Tax=Novosphingobium sp. TaxID=1874826 RepID=UPI002B47AFA3|nr:hypothetical protein [Novosphingobium sp.]HKR90842.1 hypothetical protein [Novosphingobium sp.]
MAFIDFSGAMSQVLDARKHDLSTNSGPSGLLSALELRVVELARDDGLETLRSPRRRGWLGKLIFGPVPVSPTLADNRLEALRRLAVQVWRQGYLLPSSALREAYEAGYNEAQVGAVIDSIGRSRTLSGRLPA